MSFSCVRAAATIAAASLLLVSCAASTSDDAIEGLWGNPTAAGQPSLEFAPDGTYTGTDGCNRVGGQFTQADNGSIDLGEMHATMMYCEGVETWLLRSRSAAIEDNALVLTDEDGATIGTLDRADQ